MQLDKEQFLKLENTIKESTKIENISKDSVLVIHFPSDMKRLSAHYIEEIADSISTQFDVDVVMLPDSVSLDFKNRAGVIKELKKVIKTLEDPKS